ncbi:MAG: flagellar brake protein [Gammaproteobacteria bacterium]|nr:flagellar brake protein [Gammaproteobacteria bacterium]
MEKDFIISNQARISWIMQSLRDDHQLIDVDFPDRKIGARSIIVDVNADEGYFSIDEFPSAGCHKQALAGEAFDLRASLNGVDVTAKALVVENVIDDPHGALYQIQIPGSVHYVQRRETFRARVTGLIEVPVEIALVPPGDAPDQEPVTTEAQLADISADGCRLSLSGEEGSVFGALDQRWTLRMQFPDTEEPLNVRVITRHSRFLERSKLWYVGCQFDNNDARSQQLIDRFVTQVQRLERQREAMFD